MKKFYLIIITLFLSLNYFIHSYASAKIEIVGNERISNETIKIYGDIADKDKYTNNDLDKILKNLFETKFFEDVLISFENNILLIKVKEYPIINTIQINGEPKNEIQEYILKILNSKEKGSFIKSNIAKDVELIKNFYKSLSFNNIKVEAKYDKIIDGRSNLIIDLDKGTKTKIKKIIFIGDKKVNERRLRDVIVSEESKFWKVLSRNTNLNQSNLELDKRLLSNYYKSAGFYDVEILSTSAIIEKNNEATLTYNINAGTRYRISKIATNVNPSLDKKVFTPLNKDFSKIIGDYYSPFKVKSLLDSLDILINNNDLQFIEHSVNEVINKDTIEVVINIYEGKKDLLERINITGNNITNENVIRGVLLLDEGDPFNKLKLDQSIAKIKSKNIFGSVKHNVVEGSEKDTKILNIDVEEKPTGEISAGAGIGTDGGSFAFNISENNWLGQGIRVSSFIDVNANSLKGSIDVTNPNYDDSGNALGFNISSVTNDFPNSGYENSLVSVGVNTKFEQFRNVYFAPGVNLTSDKLTVLSNASENLKKQAGTFTDLSLDYSFLLDNRDRSFMPTKGTFATFSQTLPVFADSPSVRNTVQYNRYNSFNEDMIGAFKFYASAVNGIDEDVRLSKRINLSSSRLRGFNSNKVGPKDGNDYVGGNYATTANFELALPNFLPESTKTDIGFFFDVGNVWGVDYSSTVDDSFKVRSSTGINANWLSPVGPMNFTFAQNITKATTDETQSFKFQLGTTF